AGFVEKDVTVGGSRIHYAEGPDNGPALLLIHGQIMDWTSYARVLPDLAEEYHVFVVDCHGHGKSDKDPRKYSARAMGRDLAQFIRQVIGEPAVVSGHSSDLGARQRSGAVVDPRPDHGLDQLCPGVAGLGGGISRVCGRLPRPREIR